MLWDTLIRKLKGSKVVSSRGGIFRNGPVGGDCKQMIQHISGMAPQEGTAKNHHAGQQAMHCANCDIDFLWAPTIVQGKTYCCTGCAAGGPCNCDYSQYRSVNIAGVIHYDAEEGNARTYSSSHSEDRPKQR